MSQPRIDILKTTYQLNNSEKNPYETFLSFSNSKKQVSKYLSELLNKYASTISVPTLSILDIGCGTGDIIVESLENLLRFGCKINLTGLDLSSDMIGRYKQTLEMFQGRISNLEFIKSHWLEAEINFKYYIEIASHIHIDRKDPSFWIIKMMQNLERDGIMVFVNNTDDVLNEFKNKFRPRIFGEGEFKAYPPLLSDDVKKFVMDMYQGEVNIEEIVVPVTITFPEVNSEDFRKLLSFLIGKNTQWDTLENDIRKEISNFIIEKNKVFDCKESILIVSRKLVKQEKGRQYNVSGTCARK